MRTSDHSWGRFPRRTLQLGALWCGFWSVGCHKFEDCDLYNTCPGALTQMAVAAAGEAGKSCSECLQMQGCDGADRECGESLECSFTARCRFMTDPISYQKCLLDLSERGYSVGTERRYPWEGDPRNSFLTCLEPCQTRCTSSEARWGCRTPIDMYEGFTLRVSFVLYYWTEARHSDGTPQLRAPIKIQVRACRDEGSSGVGCGPAVIAREFLPADVPVEASDADKLYLEIRACKDGPDLTDCVPLPESSSYHFPPTLFYPGALLAHANQPLAAYLLRTTTVSSSNHVLGRGPEVLKQRAQSVVLPDSCIWESMSAGGVSVHLEELDLPLCFADAQPICRGRDCAPCVWYANRDQSISPRLTETEGAGAGIVGLEGGSYTIVATESSTGRLIARRKVQMRPGWLTIVRTWPGLGDPR